MPFKTYYERLGVAADVSQDNIKSAYRKLAHELHPDKLPDDISPKMEELAKKEFNELREAYLVLSNPSARVTYDRRLIEQTESNRSSQVVAQEKEDSGDRLPKRWQVPLAAAAIGAACAVIVVSLINAVAAINRQPAAQVSSTTSPHGLIAANGTNENSAASELVSEASTVSRDSTPEAVAVADRSEPSLSGNMAEARETSDATEVQAETEFTPGEITRFATALLELQPILNSTKANLESASSSAERQDIENEFDVRATQILLSHGLQPEEYQRIAARTETDSQVRLEVIAATVRLQQLSRYQ
ncbi:MAG: DnaJ domain-containing protein [Synechococcus sp.]